MGRKRKIRQTNLQSDKNPGSKARKKIKTAPKDRVIDLNGGENELKEHDQFSREENADIVRDLCQNNSENNRPGTSFESGVPSQNPSNSAEEEHRSRRRRIKKKTIDEDETESLDIRVKWTEEEIKNIMDGLDKYGLTRINAISEKLHKTPEKIKMWLWKLGRIAHKKKKDDRKVSGKCKEDCSVAVALATVDRSRKKVANIKPLSAISKSILLISALEDHPPALRSQHIDFKKLYTALYMAIKGYPLPKMNEVTKKFFVESIELVLKGAKNNLIVPSSREYNESSQMLADSPTLNPLSLEAEFLQAKCKITTPCLMTPLIKDWLTAYDWSLL